MPSPDSDTTCQCARLADIESIASLKKRYFQYIDEKRWSELRPLFAGDATIEASSGRSGAVDDFLRSIEELSANSTTVHLAHAPDMELTGPDTASGFWRMTYYQQWPGEPVPTGRWGFRNYRDEYRREPGGWRISSMRVIAIDADPMSALPHE